jgi:hypothetical protein
LMNYVLGLSITSPLGATWQLAPQFGDLTSVQGGFTTSLGKFQASWRTGPGGSYDLEFDVPASTKGEVVLPLPAGTSHPSITMNGKSVNEEVVFAATNTGKIVISEGGTYQITVS